MANNTKAEKARKLKKKRILSKNYLAGLLLAFWLSFKIILSKMIFNALFITLFLLI